MKYYTKAELAVHVIYVNIIPFLNTLTNNLHKSTVSVFKKRDTNYGDFIGRFFQAYGVHKSQVTVIHMYLQFKVMKDRINPGIITILASTSIFFQILNNIILY